MTTQRPHPDLATSGDRQSAPALPYDPFGIYIHIPFCTHICPYCDFNTFAGQESRIPAYVEATQREVALWAPRFEGRLAASIFLGGGTPSLLSPASVASTIEHCREAFDLASDAEITIEANPNDINQGYCERLLEAGVNRLSIGAQTLDRKGLRVLGRLHEADQVGSAMSVARRAGFNNISLDFIFGWPGQTLETWRSDLERVISGSVGDSKPDHLSLYGLIVEPGTPMADAVARGILTPVDEERSAEFLELAISLLAAHGWTHYEIANWAARPDRVSRHNTIYWRNGDYAGIGAGAHGHVGDMRTMNQPSPRRYIDALDAGKSPVTNTETIDDRTSMGETMMLGLRLLQEGVSSDAFYIRHHRSMSEAYGPTIAKLESLGLLTSDSTRLLLTERGAMLANSVCAEFL